MKSRKRDKVRALARDTAEFIVHMEHLFICLLAVAALSLASCATTPGPDNQLSHRILRFYKDFDGLAHTRCVKYSGDDCKDWQITHYDLGDPSIRKLLIDLTFICNVSGKLYEVCKDKPGLCRYTYIRKKWFHFTKKPVETYISVKDGKSFLISAGAFCMNRKKYNLAI